MAPNTKIPKEMDHHEDDSLSPRKNPVLFRARTFAETHPLPSYHGNVCIVTGGTTGIGEATCAAFVEAGASAVYNLDIALPPPAHAEEKQSGKGRLHHVKCDVSKPAELKAAIESVFEKEGRIDHLVSNAGVWVGGEPMEDISEAEFDRVVGINVKGCFFA